MVRAIGQLQFQYLLALAQVRLATYAYLAAVIVQVALFFPMVQNFGVAGMAITVLISTTVVTLTQSYLLQKRVGQGMREFSSTLGWAVCGIGCAILVYGTPITNLPTNEVPIASTKAINQAAGSEVPETLVADEQKESI